MGKLSSFLRRTPLSVIILTEIQQFFVYILAYLPADRFGIGQRPNNHTQTRTSIGINQRRSDRFGKQLWWVLLFF